MDRIDSATIFVAVAEQGGFAAAARRLGRSPSAVTRAVAELEARLGVRLFNRTTRAVSLTEVGARFLAGAKRVLADFDEIERAVAGEGTAPRGELAITAPILFGRLHMLPIIGEFLRGFPDVRARLVLVDRPVDLVDEGLDVALRIGELSDSSAIAIRVGAVRRVVVAAPAYLDRHGAPGRPCELSDRDVIVSAGLGATDRWLFGDAAVPLAPRLIVTTAEAAIEAAKDGLGITRVLSYQAADALGAGTLAALFTEPESRAVPVHILYPGGRHPAPKLRAFVDFAVPRLRRRLERLAESLR